MHRTWRLSKLLARAVVEWLCFFAVSYWLMILTTRAAWTWCMPASAVAEVASATCIVALAWLSGCLLKRHCRWSDNATRSTAPDGFDYLLVASAVATAPLAILLNATTFIDPRMLNDVSVALLTASVLAILGAAWMEEVLYRLLLMGRLLRGGTPPLLALSFQAGVFVLTHGPSSRISADALAWYAVGGLLLGAIYLRTRRLAFSIAVHFSANVAMALKGGNPHWLLIPFIEAFQRPWRPYAASAMALLTGLILVRHFMLPSGRRQH